MCIWREREREGESYVYMHLHTRHRTEVTRGPGRSATPTGPGATANLRTTILHIRGYDSNPVSSLRGGIIMSIESVPECLSQRMLVGWAVL